MIICRTAKSFVQARQASGIPEAETGFVPTMGALHDGHLQLLARSRVECRQSVVSIFVNPTQFNDPSDFAKYPRTTETDIDMLQAAGCDILFLPDVEEVYQAGDHFPEHYDLGRLESLLEGAHRPGHYQGVCKVMHRLMRLVQPGSLFMGQKDYQQCMVVQKLMADHNLHARFVMVPTIREADGLAMSSRNRRLTPKQREIAPAIYREMSAIAANIDKGNYRELEKQAADKLLQAGFAHIDYVSIADARTLEPAEPGTETGNKVCLVAAFLGEVRLIDNLPIP